MPPKRYQSKTHRRLALRIAERKAREEYRECFPNIVNIGEFKTLRGIPRLEVLITKLTDLFEEPKYQKKTETLFYDIKNFDLAREAVINSDLVKPLSDEECEKESFKQNSAYIAVNGCKVVHAMITSNADSNFATILVAMYESPQHALSAVDLNNCADGLVYFGVLDGKQYMHLRKLMVASIKCNYLRHSAYEHESSNLEELAKMISMLDDITEALLQRKSVSENLCEDIDAMFEKYGFDL